MIKKLLSIAMIFGILAGTTAIGMAPQDQLNYILKNIPGMTLDNANTLLKDYGLTASMDPSGSGDLIFSTRDMGYVEVKNSLTTINENPDWWINPITDDEKKDLISNIADLSYQMRYDDQKKYYDALDYTTKKIDQAFPY